MNFKKLIALILALGAVFAFSACTDPSPSAAEQDERSTEASLRDLQKAHPVPKFAYSQYRQNLVDIVTAQAEATPTTTFFFNSGVKDPIFSCPSVGFPIPGTAQLTNPDQIARASSSYGYAILPQVEPNGVYTGETTNTTTICRDANGRGYAVGWEGFAMPITGPAEWNAEKGVVELIGAPTAKFSTGE
jgi:hypothetical protein